MKSCRAIKKLLFFFFLSAMVPAIVFAAPRLELKYPGLDVGNNLTISSFVYYLFGLSILISAFLIIFISVRDGFKYFIFFDDTNKAKNFKANISAAFTGIIILLFAWIILNTINPQLTAFDINTSVFAPDNTKIDLNQRKNTTTYMVIPVGEMIEQSTFSKDFMLVLADYVKHLKLLEDTTKELKTKSDELYQLMKNCTCGQGECESKDCPCQATKCSGSKCDLSRIKEIKQEIPPLLEKQQQAAKFFEDKLSNKTADFSNPNYSIKQLSAVHTLLSLVPPDQIATYQDMLSFRASEGNNDAGIAITTTPFTQWQKLYERKPSDQFMFFVTAKNQANEIQKSASLLSRMDISKIEDPGAPDLNNINSISAWPYPDDDALPTPPKELANVPQKYLPFTQWGPQGTLTNCPRGSGGSNMNTGCADTTLTTIIAHWYTWSSGVRQAWKEMIARNPIPSQMSSDCKKPVGFNGDTPNTYTVLYLMNGFKDKNGTLRRINDSVGAWDTSALEIFLNELNLNLSWDSKLFLKDIQTWLKVGYSVSVYCDYYRYQYRSCCKKGGPVGEKCELAFACDHWMTAYEATDSYIKFSDPAGNITGESISAKEFQNMGCGAGQAGTDKRSFRIIPKQWP